MKPTARPALIALALAAAALTAGCGSAASSGPGPTGPVPPAGAPFLATSLVTPAGTWAIAVMGGSVSSHNNFWQLFARPAGSTIWKLVTPPGVADNGGLVAASARAGSLITGIRPSQYLTYTPLALTHDGGQAWSPTGPLDAALAATPDALAAAPGTGRLLALLTSGAVKAAAPGYTRWTTLTSQRSLAVTPAGRRCGLTGLTAVTVTPAGVPLLAGRCSRPGTAGIFAAANGTWQAAGPALPAGLDHQPGYRAAAHASVPWRRGPPGDWFRAGREPAGRLVGRRRRSLGPVTPDPSPGRQAGLGVLRTRRNGRARSDPRPRGHHHRRRGGVAVPARPARRHRHAGTRARWRVRRAGGPPHQADRLATRARCRWLAGDPGHERSRPVRLIRLKGISPAAAGLPEFRGVRRTSDVRSAPALRPLHAMAIQ